jgi:hypothetical protein
VGEARNGERVQREGGANLREGGIQGGTHRLILEGTITMNFEL